MKKFLKKTIVFAIAAIMMLAMAVPAFAAPTAKDLVVSGITDGSTVTFYKVVGITVDENTDTENPASLWQYAGAEGETKLTEADLPMTSDDAAAEQKINAIANRLFSNKADKLTPLKSETATVSGGKAKITTNEAGMYIAVVTDPKKTADGKVVTYNPVLVSLYYNKDKELEAGTVDLASGSYQGDGVAKSKPVDGKKEVSGGYADVDAEGNAIQTGRVGTVFTYTLTLDVPVYPSNAINKTLFVSDEMSKGLSFQYNTLKVKLGDGTAIPINNNQFASGTTVYGKASQTTEGLVDNTGNKNNGFYINFDYDQVDAAVGATNRKIVITYDAILNKDAVVGVPGNDNDFDYIFSRNPNKGGTHDKENEKPKTDEASGNEKIEDSKKVYTYEVSLKKVGIGDDATKLANAKFGVYEDADCTKLVDVIITNADGYGTSKQIEVGDGTDKKWYIKEIEAPGDYQLNEKVYEVVVSYIACTTKNTASQTMYEWVTDKAQALGGENAQQTGWIYKSKFYDMNDKSKIALEGTDTEADILPAYVKSTSSTSTTTSSTTLNTNGGAGAGTAFIASPIPNTKASELPSTGGMGTYIFTIIGVAVVAIAAGMLIFRRKQA